jgi:N-carbamoylputrescine amidase
MALDGAHAIFIPHASPRGLPREKFDSWMRHLSARAFDNGIYIVACNQTGDNGQGLFFPGVAVVIDPSGKVMARRLEGEEGLLFADLTGEGLSRVQGHRMRYFLPNRRDDLY